MKRVALIPRAFLFAMGTALLVLLAGGCATAPVQDIAEGVVAELKAQAEEWDRAIVRKDRDAIAANMADDFRNIDGTGNISDKAQFIKDIMAPELTMNPYSVEEFDVRVYGDTALLSGRTRMTGVFAGQPFVFNYRYIDVYVWREGRWKVVSVQITRLPN